MGIKSLFNRNKEEKGNSKQYDITTGSNDFDITTAPNSTGNAYEFRQELDASIKRALISTGDYIENYSNPKKIKKSDLKGADYDEKEFVDFIDQRSLNEWFMLQLQANYFTNTINFRCSNYSIENSIRKVIRAAYLYGKAGLYFDELVGKWVPVMVSQEVVSKSGDIIGGKLYIIQNFDKQYDFEKNRIDYVLDISNASNLAIFRWGVDTQSAIIYHYPFVRLQTQILKQLSLTSLVLAKKIQYHVQGNVANKEEISNWLNPFKFIVSVFNGGTKNGRFELVKRENNDNGLAEIEYYKHLTNVYYSLFGRRVNDDIKKERNITDEVSATQESFDVLQENWKSMFRLFIKQLKSINKGSVQLGEVEVYD